MRNINIFAILVKSHRYGQHIITFDQSDYEIIKDYKWYVVKGNSTFYANGFRTINGVKECVQMHRLIMNPGNSVVDHIDGNGLNNTRVNIRICTQHQNNMNCRLGKNNKSGFKGVSWDKARGKYAARICVNYKTISLGRFQTAIKAADEYNKAALKHFGDFAKLNPL